MEFFFKILKIEDPIGLGNFRIFCPVLYGSDRPSVGRSVGSLPTDGRAHISLTLTETVYVSWLTGQCKQSQLMSNLYVRGSGRLVWSRPGQLSAKQYFKNGFDETL